MHAAERAENVVFCPWWPWPLTLIFKLVRSRDQTRLSCQFGVKSVQRFPRYFTHKQKNQRQCQKQNLTHFTVCGHSSLRAVIIVIFRKNRAGHVRSFGAITSPNFVKFTQIMRSETTRDSGSNVEKWVDDELDVHHALVNDGVATSLTDDEVSPLDDHDRHKERRVTRELQRLALRVRLTSAHTVHVNSFHTVCQK